MKMEFAIGAFVVGGMLASPCNLVGAAQPASGNASSPSASFAKSIVPMYANMDDATQIGSIMPGTAVSQKRQNEKSKTGREEISLEGWSTKGASSVIYSEIGQRMILATLSGNAFQHEKILDQKIDAYGTAWKQVLFSGWVNKAQFSPDITTVWASARDIYGARCSSCHALHSPTEFTANQWPGILETMTQKAALSPADAALVTQYLQAHARLQ